MSPSGYRCWRHRTKVKPQCRCCRSRDRKKDCFSDSDYNWKKCCPKNVSRHSAIFFPYTDSGFVTLAEVGWLWLPQENVYLIKRSGIYTVDLHISGSSSGVTACLVNGQRRVIGVQGLLTCQLSLQASDKVHFPLQPANTLTASVAQGQKFGLGVISCDGLWAAIGTEASSQGQLFVFQQTVNGWQSLLEIDDQNNGGLDGVSALNQDGSLLAVPFPLAQTTGLVKIYLRAGANFSQIQTLTPPDSGQISFGADVALTGSGNLLLVGAPLFQSAIGRAYLYRQTNQQYDLVCTINSPQQAEGELFGQQVAISKDGSWLAVASPSEVGQMPTVGRVAIYQFSENLCEFVTMINGPIQLFGSSLALDQAGQKLVVASPLSNSIFIYTRDNNNNWTQQQVISNNQGLAPTTVSINSNGTRLAYGALPFDIVEAAIGEAYIYDLMDNTWQLIHTLTSPAMADNNQTDEFGANISLDGSGTTLLVGAPASNQQVGIVYQYLLTAPCIQVNVAVLDLNSRLSVVEQ